MAKNYLDFKKELVGELSAVLGADGIRVKETVVTKTNGERDGIELQIPGHNASPVFYPSEWYKRYLDGCTLSKIVATVKEQAGQARMLPGNLSFDYRYLAEHIYPVVINAERSGKLLSCVPHEMFHDLAIVPRCRVDGMETPGSFYVTNDYLRSLHMSPNECMDLAMDSLTKQGFSAMPMDEAIAQCSDGNVMVNTADRGNEFLSYVLTNGTGLYGAAAMLDRRLLADVAERLGTERIFVLPSSVHEIICMAVPENADAMTVRQMENMVYTVNRTEVLPDDYLSDNVYLFNRMDMSLEIATSENICPASQKEAASMTMHM